ncbi:MAG TPA: hypothetical protein PLV57_07380 [Phycisphaerae bacterium]|nr:hypothetical protein [Phycisphaerae bacterium]HOM49897.1 hypothetical protein [Phycisphaerae bacterium]HPP26325.1 hypothetical protein [Phycisphaerae bacterium]
MVTINRTRRWIGTVLLWLTAGACWAAFAAASSNSAASPGATAPADAARPVASTRPVPPGEDQIRQAIRDLNHPSPSRRREAVRQLADWGPLAFDALAQVAAGPELEPALLARDLLRQMGEVLFVGARVRLEADHTHIRWDQPVNLSVHVDNPTPARVVVPWPAELAVASSQPAPEDCDQVAAMMDIADFLLVVGPDGEEVATRVDPIEQDTAVHRAVLVRAGNHPPSHAVPAESNERLVVPRFNRGWARFPMLAAGTYTVRFAYQPQWRDPAWIAQGFGLIESNPVTIEVTEAAPEAIRQADRPVRLNLRQEENGRFLGEIQNVWDRELWLNLNIGGPVETHARLEWMVWADDESEAVTFALDDDATGPQFAADYVRQMAPGEKATVTTARLETVLERYRRAADQPSGQVMISLKYTHIPSAQALRQALREKGRRESVPSQLFNGSAMSEPMQIAPNGG